jgi:hypothetical protein
MVVIEYETWHWLKWPRWWRPRWCLARWTGCEGEGQVETLKRRTTRWWSLSKTWRRQTDSTVKIKWSQGQWIEMVMWWYEVDHIFWKNKMGSRQRYNHKAILFCTQDTIEGVSGLGSIAKLLRGEILSIIRCTGATRWIHEVHCM